VSPAFYNGDTNTTVFKNNLVVDVIEKYLKTVYISEAKKEGRISLDNVEIHVSERQRNGCYFKRIYRRSVFKAYYAFFFTYIIEP
jgi:hypothetical protein